MDKVKLQKLYYHLRHRYLTMNNVVVGAALLLAASWAWGSVGLMQRNYGLQRDVDAKQREAEMLELEVATMQYQQNYYKSEEYKKEFSSIDNLKLVKQKDLKITLTNKLIELVIKRDTKLGLVYPDMIEYDKCSSYKVCMGGTKYHIYDEVNIPHVKMKIEL